MKEKGNSSSKYVLNPKSNKYNIKYKIMVRFSLVLPWASVYSSYTCQAIISQCRTKAAKHGSHALIQSYLNSLKIDYHAPDAFPCH